MVVIKPLVFNVLDSTLPNEPVEVPLPLIEVKSFIVVPSNVVMVVEPIVPPFIASPLIWSAANVNVPPLTSKVYPLPTVMFVPSIAPLSILTLVIASSEKLTAPACS